MNAPIEQLIDNITNLKVLFTVTMRPASTKVLEIFYEKLFPWKPPKWMLPPQGVFSSFRLHKSGVKRRLIKYNITY